MVLAATGSAATGSAATGSAALSSRPIGPSSPWLRSVKEILTFSKKTQRQFVRVCNQFFFSTNADQMALYFPVPWGAGDSPLSGDWGGWEGDFLRFYDLIIDKMFGKIVQVFHVKMIKSNDNEGGNRGRGRVMTPRTTMTTTTTKMAPVAEAADTTMTMTTTMTTKE